MRLPTLLAYSSATILLSLAACGDRGRSDDATFAKATEAQRQRAVMAASGTDAAIAYLIASTFTAPGARSCPTVSTSGSTVTATFHCTDDSGSRLDGVIKATNLAPIFGPGGGDFDPTKGQVVELEGYRVHAPEANRALGFDGANTIHPDRGMDVALDATLLGAAVYTDATFDRSADRTFAAAGSFVDLDGLGRADIAGTWNLTDDAPAGMLELKGADTLRADIAAMVDGCVPLTIDGGAAGELCLQTADEE